MSGPNQDVRGAVIGVTLAVLIAAGLGLYLGCGAPEKPAEKPAPRDHLKDADDNCEAALKKRLGSVHGVFAKGRNGAPLFAEEALSFSGKLNAILGLVDDTGHKRFLAESFARYVLTSHEVEAAIEGAIRGYVLDVEDAEAQMLVRLRADLAGVGGVDLPGVQSDEAFQKEYRRLLEKVSGDLRADLGVDVARLVSSEVIAAIATQAAVAAAAEMGVTVTVFGSATVATLGIGAVFSIAADYIIGLVLDFAGYNAERQIAGTVVQSLNTLEASLLREAGPTGALRAQMQKVHDARSKVRREVIQQYLKGGVK